MSGLAHLRDLFFATFKAHYRACRAGELQGMAVPCQQRARDRGIEQRAGGALVEPALLQNSSQRGFTRGLL